MSRLLLFSAFNYLFSAPCYLKTAFLLANHNRERDVQHGCILGSLLLNLFLNELPFSFENTSYDPFIFPNCTKLNSLDIPASTNQCQGLLDMHTQLRPTKQIIDWNKVSISLLEGCHQHLNFGKISVLIPHPSNLKAVAF